MIESRAEAANSPATVVRRPVGARNWGWIQSAARMMAKAGVSPNSVSIASVAFAAACAAVMLMSRFGGAPSLLVALLLAPLFVIGRGLCNVLDGLIAVEGGRKTRSGELFNDFPDRVADLLFYVPAGYLVSGMPFGVEFGWAAGALAVLTAYVRLLGGAMGATQRFLGPMAKTHRMAVFSVGCVAAAATSIFDHGTTWPLGYALAIIAVGCLITSARRAIRIVRDLESGR